MHKDMPIQRVIKKQTNLVTLFIFLFVCTTIYATQSRTERKELPISTHQKISQQVSSLEKLDDIIKKIRIQKNTLKTKLEKKRVEKKRVKRNGSSLFINYIIYFAH